MRSNILRDKLNRNETTLCTRVVNTTPSIIEAIGQTGIYDYVEFVAEYGSYDLHGLENLCRAAELHGLGSMIKIDQSHQWFTAQRGVGAGFQSVLFTDVRSADDVRKCVQYVRPETPEDGGLYGIANRRNVDIGKAGSPEYLKMLREIVVVVMIEKRAAVEQLDEILSVPGLDMVQWGGSDYSMSIGHPGERDHPEVVKARDRVFEAAIAKGVAPRAELQRPDQAREYLDMGVRHFSIGADLQILYDWWLANGTALREAIGS